MAGYLPAQLIAHSYLGGLWIALDQRQGKPGRPVLLRHLQLQEGIPSEALQRMACAARDAMALSHENVLHVLAVLQQAESLAVAYEYVEAEPLRSLQTLASQRNLRFPVAVSLRIVIDLARGIKALHGTLAGWPSAPPFGGVSPDSVLVARDGRTRLCDALTASCATLLEGLSLNVAKLAYTAPEQAYATAPLAPASDVFSCGVVLWELLAGTRLLSGSRPTVERKLLEHDWPRLAVQLAGQNIAPALLDMVERCLSSDASKRPQTPSALAHELEQCGETVAQLPEVARFIAELAAPHFDQRKLAVRASLVMPAPNASLALLAPFGTASPSLPALAAATRAAPAVATPAPAAPPPAAPAAAPAAATPSPALPAAAEPALASPRTMLGTAPQPGPTPAAAPAPAATPNTAAATAQRSLPVSAGRVSAANLRIPLPTKLGGMTARSQSLPSAAAPASPSAAPAAASPSDGAKVASANTPSAAAPGRYSLPGGGDSVSLARIPLVRASVPRPRNSQTGLRAVSLPAPAPSLSPQRSATPSPERAAAAAMAMAERVATPPPAFPATPRPFATPVPALPERGSAASGPSAAPGMPPERAYISSAAPPPAATANPPTPTPTPTRTSASAAPPVPIFGVRRMRRNGAQPAPAHAPAGSQPSPSDAPATERSPSLLDATSAPRRLEPSTPPDSGWESNPPGITPGPLAAAPAVAADADAPLSQEAVVIPEARAVPTGMTTLMGIPVPPPVLLPTAPFATLPPPRLPSHTPGSSPAVVVIPPESHDSVRPPSVSSLPPLPMGSLVPTLSPPPFSDPPGVPSSAPGLRREGGWSHPPPPHSTRSPRRRSWLARAGATIALGAAAITVLWVRDAGHGSTYGAASAALRDTAQLPPPRDPERTLPPRAAVLPEAAAPASAQAPAAPASTALPEESVPRALGDEQLLELFALEQRSALAECTERRLTPRSLASRDKQKSQAQLKAGRREQERGNIRGAQALLCSATQLHPGNIAAWQALAELALQRGDGAQAQRTLERALKIKPGERTLLLALGDAHALRGNLQQSRTLWARSAPADDRELQPSQRLAAQFDSAGELALNAGSFDVALAQYRRAVVLSGGASSPSAGMASSLRALKQPLAAAPWEQRATALRR